MALIFILDNHLSVHIRRAISHSHMTYAEIVPSWFLLNSKVVQVTSNILQSTKSSNKDSKFTSNFTDIYSSNTYTPHV